MPVGGADLEQPRTVEQSLLLLLDIAHHFRQLLNNQTRELTGLTLEQAVVLGCVQANHSVITISDIAAQLSRTNHTITGRINSLERRGLVSRTRTSDGDHRRVQVDLTDEGYARLASYQELASNRFESLLHNSGRADAVDRLSKVIETLSDLLPEW